MGIGTTQEVKTVAPDSRLQTSSNGEGESASEPGIESAEQLQARKEILSLCEKLASQDDPSELRPLYTEEAFKIQCGEWVLTAVDMASMDGELEELKELKDLKQFVQKNGLDKLELEPIFQDDQSMFGGKVVADVYDLLPAANRLEIAMQCGSLVNAMLRQFAEMDGEAEQVAAGEDSQPREEGSPAEEPTPLDYFLGGKVQEIVWNDGRATLKAGIQPSEISDEELEEMGLERDGLTESPFPDKFLNFVQIDGKWLYAGVDTAKSYASFKDKLEKFPSTNMDLSIPLIENIQIAGEAVSNKQIALSDYKGKVVLIDCWGTWCGPGVASLPPPQSLPEEFHAQGLEIIGIAADEKEELEQFLKKRPLPWEQIVDAEGKLAEQLGVQAYPTLLLVDRDGKNVKNFVGESAELKQAIVLLLEGKSLEALVEPADAEPDQARQEK